MRGGVTVGDFPAAVEVSKHVCGSTLVKEGDLGSFNVDAAGTESLYKETDNTYWVFTISAEKPLNGLQVKRA
jgi:hypothetical protein